MIGIEPRGIAKTFYPPGYDPKGKITNELYEHWRQQITIIQAKIKSK